MKTTTCGWATRTTSIERSVTGGPRLACAIVLAAAGAVSAGTAAEAQSRPGPVVEVEWLAEQLRDPNVLVLHADMRRAGYDAGHIPGARFLDLNRFVWDGDPAWGTEMRTSAEIGGALRQLGVTDETEHIVVYSTNPLFASRAFMTMEVVGLQGRVHVLDGGHAAWVASGRETTTEEPAPAGAGVLTLGLLDNVLVTADWIHERLENERLALVDARPDDEYTGEDEGMGGMANPGHIPGAHQMYWEELIESRESPYLHDRSRLAELFEQAGVSDGDTVVAYCMVGWRASYTYLAARLLGYDTRFYDGSWHDWGTRDDLPYVTGAEPGR